VWSMRSPLKNRYVGWLLNAVLLSYFAGYIALSSQGGYDGPFASGKTRIFDNAWSVRDKFIWQPMYACFGNSGYNFLGVIFSPMIVVDRFLWHRDKLIGF
jgi:hypothetical protein